MTKIFFTFILIAGSNMLFSQLRMNSAGNVGIGTTNPAYDCRLDINGGNLRMYNNYGYFKIQPNATYPTARTAVGASNGYLAFWYAGVGYNHVYFADYTKISDRKLKQNIQPLENGIKTIMRLETHSYNYTKEATIDDKKKHYGFIAQEMYTVLPDVVDSAMGFWGVSYSEIIPFLVKGMQEQQDMINIQQECIDNLNEKIESLEEQSSTRIETKKAQLFQNSPNPFKENTTVNFILPAVNSSASIMVFDMSGLLLKEFPIIDDDQNQIEIKGREFKPGMYLYSLVLDGKEVDTKKMILNK